jgi:peptide-methionine (S)-S-oxide reductase
MTRSRLTPVALGVIMLAVAAGVTATPSLAGEGRAIPAPAVDQPAAGPLQSVTLAGGCFWGVQGVFQHVRGVTRAVSGYAGGDRATATYSRVSGGDTGHAEAVRVTFDPGKVSFGRILQVYFSVAHDPTELNRQGPDVGRQYRSAIFAATGEQARIAKAYIAQLARGKAFYGTIVTTVETGGAFYPAEANHQDFLTRNPTNPYIVRNDLPKIAALRTLAPALYRADPVLVAARVTN